MLWQHLFSLDHVMCTEAQQRHDHYGCYPGHGHLHSTDAQTIMLPSSKGTVRDNICQTEVNRTPSVCSSMYIPLAIFFCNDKLQMVMTLNN